MNSSKMKLYYLSRFLGWNLLLSWTAFAVGILMVRCCFEITSINLLMYKLSKTNLTELPDTDIFVKIFICLIVYIVLLILATRLSLSKVFFKPYKRILITPKIEKVTFGLAASALVQMNIVVVILLTFLLAISKYFYGLLGLILFATLEIAIIVGGPAFIVDRIVRKNATIDAKVQE